MTVPYGSDDDEETALLLRSPPPTTALDWVAQECGATVQRVEALRGGYSSAVHRILLTSEAGTATNVVLRRYVRSELNIEEPDIAVREAETLSVIAALDLPTPELLAADLTGEQCGVPTLLMTHLAGLVEWTPHDVEVWLRNMAEILPPIHAADDSIQHATRRYQVYGQVSYDPPPWASAPLTWERAVQIAAADNARDSTFVHRDFHPGNVLWQDGHISGVVDWQAASVGPSDVDVGHCRINLLRSHNIDVANRFTQIWEQITGRTYDPWADVAFVVGCLDNLRDAAANEFTGVEPLLAQAVACIRA